MLFMICEVKVTACDRSSIIVRALIDFWSLALFVYERIAQYLRLQCSNKNVSEKGVAGTITCT